MKLALRPVGKNAPPRPRRFDSTTCWITACGSSARAFSSCTYPPTARYDSRLRSGSPSNPARTSAGPSATRTVVSLIAELLHDRRDVRLRHRLPVDVVDGHDRRRRAAAEALDGAERDLAVLGRLA